MPEPSVQLSLKICFGWGIRHITTSPFYPKPNHVERFKRNLKIALTIFHHDQQSVWDENLPMFSIGFNSAIHQSTKMTPAHLFLGRELQNPLELKWEVTDGELNSDIPVSQGVLKKHWETALVNLKRARDRTAARYNSSRSPHSFSVGDCVSYRLHPLSSAANKVSAKLLPRGSCPLITARFLTPVTVQLANPETGVIIRKAHVDSLKWNEMQ
jgi:hypothetical protein